MRQARTERRMTRAELAKAVGVSESAVRAWERGASQPRERRLYALAQVLDVTPEWLAGGEPEPELVATAGPRFYRALWIAVAVLVVLVILLWIGCLLEPDCPFA